MIGFLKRFRKKSSKGKPQNSGGISAIQTRLYGDYSTNDMTKRRYPFTGMSAKQLDQEVDKYIKDFHTYVNKVKESLLGFNELKKLLESGVISDIANSQIMEEMFTELSIMIGTIFELREALELGRAKTKLEWAKQKVRTPTDASAPTYINRMVGVNISTKNSYPSNKRLNSSSNSDYGTYSSNLTLWENLSSKIDGALSSLLVEDEAKIVEQYLSITTERPHLMTASANIERGLLICKQRLDSISERWASTRRSQIEKILSLELDISQTKEAIKEFEARFAVGEISQIAFEDKMSTLKTKLRNFEKEVSDIRSFIDDMDMKLFKCSEILEKRQ